MRYSIPLLAGLLFTTAAPAADAKKVIIRWHGQSMFEIITSAGTRIVTDPHAIEVFGRKNIEADLILTSHRHSDHVQTSVIQNEKKARIIHGLKDLKGDGKRFDWNLIDEKFKDVQLRTVPTYHDTTFGMERGKNTIFILEVDGLRIVHLGDLGHSLTDEQLRRIGPVDVLMIPVGGVYTLNGSEAREVVKQIKPRKYILPMHRGTRVYEDLLTADEFLDEQKKENIRESKTNELIVTADFKPAEPIIVLLYWDSK
jgi:L-ascorbate metabolism protein UlaG (beta-lactamase superfamily)